MVKIWSSSIRWELLNTTMVYLRFRWQQCFSPALSRLLGLVSVVPKIKENVLNARYLWWAKSSAGVQIAVGFVWDAQCLPSHWPVLSCSASPRCLGCIFQEQMYPLQSSELQPLPAAVTPSSCGDFSAYRAFPNPTALEWWCLWAIPQPRFPPTLSWAIALLHTSLDIFRQPCWCYLKEISSSLTPPSHWDSLLSPPSLNGPHSLLQLPKSEILLSVLAPTCFLSFHLFF